MKGFNAKKIAALSVMCALLVCGKLALNIVPNVEVVSLFCALFGYVFGLWAMLPATIFCVISGAYWGYNIWVVTYLIYFNLIVIIFYLLSKKQLNKPYFTAPIICVLTFLFGLIDAFLVTMLSGFENFFSRMIFYYGNGIIFCVVHIVSNTIIFALLFKILANVLQSLKLKLNI